VEDRESAGTGKLDKIRRDDGGERSSQIPADRKVGIRET